MNTFFQKFSFQSHEGFDEGKWVPNTRRDSALLFVSAFILVLCFGLFHLYLYLNMSSEDFFSTPLDVTINREDKLNVRALDATLAQFTERKDTFDMLSRNRSSFGDPSVDREVIKQKQEEALPVFPFSTSTKP